MTSISGAIQNVNKTREMGIGAQYEQIVIGDVVIPL